MECCKHAGKALHPGARRIAIRPAALHTRLLQAKAAQTDTIPVPDVDFQDTGPDEFSDGKAVLKNMTLAELRTWCAEIGELPNRAMHLWRWMYYKNWIRSFSDTDGKTNAFSSAFVEKASRLATLDSGLHLQSVHTAADGTRKLLFSIDGGGQEQVETVLIPIVRSKGKKSRMTVCVSSQIGCAMNCQFCYTGRLGLLRNLTTAQIVEQLVVAKRILAEDPDAPPAQNIVYMGMGEPFNNLDAVLASIEIATEPLGLHFSKNKITVSTVGLIPEIRRFCRNGTPAQLAVSLHASTDEIRDWIAPVNRRYPLADLMACLREEFPKGKTRGRHGHHVLFEWVMLEGVNDKEEHARQVLDLVTAHGGIECKFNLIVFNPHEGTNFRASSREATLAFRSILIQGGLVCTVRDSRGPDEMAACGQLGNAGLVQAGAARILPRPASV